MLCVCVCVCGVWCECGWRVVAIIDSAPSGLVTATPPTPLLSRGGAGRARAPQGGASAVWRGRVSGLECAYGEKEKIDKSPNWEVRASTGKME
eukprot:scaffold18656_cov146-Isochrysis_galbana.AAC.1